MKLLRQNGKFYKLIRLIKEENNKQVWLTDFNSPLEVNKESKMIETEEWIATLFFTVKGK